MILPSAGTAGRSKSGNETFEGLSAYLEVRPEADVCRQKARADALGEEGFWS